MKQTKKTRSLGQILIVYITALLVISTLIIGVSSYSVARNSLIEKGKITLKNGVKSALTMIDLMQIEVEKGHYTVDEAQNNIKEVLLGPLNTDGSRQNNSQIDFGMNGYYIVYSTEGIEILHPTLEGVKVWDYIDKAKTETPYYFVQDKIEKGLNGGGYTTYTWEYPYSEKLGEKIVYTEADSEWGWIVAAGSYISDFDRAAFIILQITLLTVLVVVLLGYWISKYTINAITHPISDVVDAMKLAEDGTYTTIDKSPTIDELSRLTKGFNRLTNAIKAAQSNLVKKDDQLLKYAYYDSLSGLPNTNYFRISVSDRMKKVNDKCALLLIDIKDFNFINSIYGTAYGDRLIEHLGKTVIEDRTLSTLVARIGGNEFSAWFEDFDESTFHNRLEKYVHHLKTNLHEAGIHTHIDFYISVATFDPSNDQLDYDDLYKRASTSLQFAKNERQHTIVWYHESMSVKFERESKLLHAAEIALNNKQFALHYQCKVDSISNEITGVESLSRWYDPEEGHISPLEFIPILYRGNLMNRFSMMVIEQSLIDLPKLEEKHQKPLTISINISPSLFFDDAFVPFMKEVIQSHSVNPEKIILEITEDIFITDFEIIVSRIDQLRAMKIKISLDDFGSGYSSLNYLAQLKFDEIKVDKTFIDHIMSDSKAYALFKSIVNIAHSLNCEVIAEGVESIEQVRMINEAGCRMIQGYVYSKPEPL